MPDSSGVLPTKVTTTVAFDAAVFGVETIKKAAYRFLTTFSIDIRQHNGEWECLLSFADGTSPSGVDKAVRDFKAEILDQDLRAMIGRETEPVRNTILAVAFSRTGLQGGE